MTDSELQEIRSLLERVTGGEWKINGIGLRKNILNIYGDWPDEDDEINMEFFSRSKEIIASLLNELEAYRAENRELKSLNDFQEKALARQVVGFGPISAC